MKYKNLSYAALMGLTGLVLGQKNDRNSDFIFPGVEINLALSFQPWNGFNFLSAIRQKNQSLNYLRMSARVDAVASRVQTVNKLVLNLTKPNVWGIRSIYLHIGRMLFLIGPAFDQNACILTECLNNENTPAFFIRWIVISKDMSFSNKLRLSYQDIAKISADNPRFR